MQQFERVDVIVETLRERHGVAATFEDHIDRHVLRSASRSVYVGLAENGDLYYGSLGVPHHHADDNVLVDHFYESVAALLKGEKACGACPD